MSKKETGFWNQAEPIWITAEKQGVRTGTMFWPGSETEINGIRPSRWVAFDQTMTGDARVDRLLSWLDLPPAERPVLETLYFDIVDSAGHRFGPGAVETREAVASVDASIGRLVEGLKARGLYERSLLVIVSDHGMADTSPDRVVWIDDIIDPSALEIGYSGAVLTTDAAPGREAEVQARLVGRHDHMECWNKADVPARLVYGSNPRVAQIVCLVETGWTATTRDRPITRAGGAHGYDNQAPEMQALFIAHGPGVTPGSRLQNLDSVDVQPFLARVLGLSGSHATLAARLSWLGVGAPIHHQAGSRDIGGFGAGEKGDGGGDLLWPSIVSKRHKGQHRLGERPFGWVHVRVGGTWAHQIDGNAARTEFPGQSAIEGFQRRFRGGVDRQAGEGNVFSDIAADRDDPTAVRNMSKGGLGRGYAGASISELTQAMGIAAPSLYGAFGDKAGLYRQSMDHYIATADCSV
ncbi:hypothetical protein LTR94_025256 [Friedmanniomyces endolithicus]|nr:hypothetical protein LTR94_025256 [Friedmanniomyces endolithicus]